MSSYLFQKAGIFYYQRLVPIDLQSHYWRKMLSFSLRTRSHKQALRKAVEYNVGTSYARQDMDQVKSETL